MFCFCWFCVAAFCVPMFLGWQSGFLALLRDLNGLKAGELYLYFRIACSPLMTFRFIFLVFIHWKTVSFVHETWAMYQGTVGESPFHRYREQMSHKEQLRIHCAFIEHSLSIQFCFVCAGEVKFQKLRLFCFNERALKPYNLYDLSSCCGKVSKSISIPLANCSVIVILWDKINLLSAAKA